jgi:membrane protein required for colicin V production
MSFLDIILGCFLAVAVFKGIRNGLFVELASLVSLVVGVYISIKFSYVVKTLLTSFNWNPKTLEITSFVILFVAVVIVISLLGKSFTAFANFAHLGIMNKIGGGFFRLLKTILIISTFLSLFDVLNYKNLLIKKETLDKSFFYKPINQTAEFVYPVIENWHKGLKSK